MVKFSHRFQLNINLIDDEMVIYSKTMFYLMFTTKNWQNLTH